MSQDTVISICVSAMEVAMKIALPLLLVGLIVGLLVSIFQAVTQIQEQTLSFIPKIAGMAVVLVVAGPWMLGQILGRVEAMAAAQEQLSLPLVARVLYGGITEEVLLRWGFMSVLVWLAWRFLQHRQGTVRGGFVGLAIVVSSVVFGVGHLPAAVVLLGGLDVSVAMYVVAANAVFGLLFGWLYWRFGLESAMVAHALTHVVNYLASSS